MDNFTPLNTGKKNKTSKFLIIGNIFLFLVLISTTGFYFNDRLIPTQQKASEPSPLPTKILMPTKAVTPTEKISTLASGLTNKPTATPTSKPTSTPALTSSPTMTPIPVPCGTKDCDNNTNPCRSGNICVRANDGSNYCSSPDFATACKTNPSFNSCCTAPGAPTATPTGTATIVLTKTASVPSVGTPQWGVYGIIGTIILVGLLL